MKYLSILIASLLLTSNSWAEDLPPLNADDIASTEYVSNRCWALTRTIIWFATEKEFKEKEIVDPEEIKKREKYWMSVLFHTVTENRGYELYSEEAMEHVKKTHYIYLAAYKDGANKHIDKTGSMLSELVTADGKFCGEISWYKDREPKA